VSHIWGEGDAFFPNRDRIALELWPAPTLLYPMEPEGVGTAMCEGVESFVERLAYQHRVMPKSIVAVVRGHYRSPRAKLPLRNSRLITGGWEAHTFAIELSKATGRPGVAACAVMLLRNCFPLAVPTRRRHCPICVREWKEDYCWTPVLWDINMVTACPVHRVRLVDNVCRKAKPQKGIPPVLPGVCGQCGSIGFRCDSSPPVASNLLEDLITDQLGSAIALISTRSLDVTYASVQAGLRKLEKAIAARDSSHGDDWRKGRPNEVHDRIRPFKTCHAVLSALIDFGFDMSELLRGRLVRSAKLKPTVVRPLTAQGWKAVESSLAAFRELGPSEEAGLTDNIIVPKAASGRKR
jgi:hypothetical protein